VVNSHGFPLYANHVNLRDQPWWRRVCVRAFGVKAYNFRGDIACYDWRGRTYWALDYAG
jgi:hypothetical protein